MSKDEWKREANVVAQRFDKSQLKGVFFKHVMIGESEKVLVERNYELHEVLGPGRSKITGFTDSRFTDAIFVDVSVRKINNEIHRISTSEARELNLGFEIEFRVGDYDGFCTNCVMSRRTVTDTDIWDMFYMDLIWGAILPNVSRKTLKELKEGEELRKHAETEIERVMKKLMGKLGLELVSVKVKWIFPEKLPEPPPARETKAEERGPTVKTGTVEGKGPADFTEESRAEERGVPEKAGTEENTPGERAEVREVTTEGPERVESGEETAERLKKERLEKEVKMQLEREQEAKDMESALQAMKLRKLRKEQEGSQKEKPEKSTEGNGPGDPGQEIVKRIGELKRAKEIAEKKYYKKELSEGVFKRLMESYEKRIIELQGKLEA